jgi:hypothetical protein
MHRDVTVCCGCHSEYHLHLSRGRGPGGKRQIAYIRSPQTTTVNARCVMSNQILEKHE